MPAERKQMIEADLGIGLVWMRERTRGLLGSGMNCPNPLKNADPAWTGGSGK